MVRPIDSAQLPEELVADVLDLIDTQVPIVRCHTLVVGTGAAGYAAANRLRSKGIRDIVMIADKVSAGASRNAGSDKQTYYKLTLSGDEPDSVRDMAQTLFSGGAMDGDIAVAEAATSPAAFLRLCDLGVPFPKNRFGEYIGYKTDHDPRERATSVGPYTSRRMVERTEEQVLRDGTTVIGECRVVDIVTTDNRVTGLLALRTDIPVNSGTSPFLLFQCVNIVYATGGPAGLYRRRVFPNGQWGANGAALRAGVRGKNVTEWQFGLASIRPKWNVSGSYMQVMPKFISTDADGNNPREFLTDYFNNYGDLLSRVFLKGYQWPFDVRKAQTGSSVIDLLVYQETVLKGRRVFLDFRSNPVRATFDPEELSEEARTYLERAGAVAETPIERLKLLNLPAYHFYLERNPQIDLAAEMLEIDVCAQHNNGGLSIDAWWHSNLEGFFPIGEAAGAHGIYRPGGAALNSGQVGAERATTYISACRNYELPPIEEFVASARPITQRALDLVDAAGRRFETSGSDLTRHALTDIGDIMSSKAGPVRSRESVTQALADVTTWLSNYERSISADTTSRRSVSRIFLIRDLLLTAYTYLSAMIDYLDHGGLSRGSCLYTEIAPDSIRPELPADAAPIADAFSFNLDKGLLDNEIQEVWVEETPAGHSFRSDWREVRPIPTEEAFFENVWRRYREDENVY